MSPRRARSSVIRSRSWPKPDRAVWGVGLVTSHLWTIERAGSSQKRGPGALLKRMRAGA
jgi:hypothetical protein